MGEQAGEKRQFVDQVTSNKEVVKARSQSLRPAQHGRDGRMARDPNSSPTQEAPLFTER